VGLVAAALQSGGRFPGMMVGGCVLVVGVVDVAVVGGFAVDVVAEVLVVGLDVVVLLVVVVVGALVVFVVVDVEMVVDEVDVVVVVAEMTSAQSSTPVVGSNALKKRVPFTFVRSKGSELSVPGLMSLTRTVPAAVPSLFQSSMP
jgi:hypothetical protein